MPSSSWRRCFGCCGRRPREGSMDDDLDAPPLPPSSSMAHHLRMETPSVISLPRLSVRPSAGAFDAKYERLELLGEGKTGQVFRARARTSPRFEAAAKVVRRDYLSTPQRQAAFRAEVAILQRIRHPVLLNYFDYFEHEDECIVVTERAHGGELLGVLAGGSDGGNRRLRECDVAAIVRQLVDVVGYLHAKGITHRDIKLDNLLCRTADARSGIVLIDFGLAHKGRVGARHEMSGMNGTCHYMAPEMFGRESRYGGAIDLWAIGVVTFVLLFGRYPFDARFMSQVEDLIVAGRFEFPEDLAREYSSPALDFILRLLVTNPQDRPTAAEIAEHPWMQVEHVSTKELSPVLDEHLRRLYEAKTNVGSGRGGR